MSRLFTLVFACACLLMYTGTSAQCTINTGNTTTGFTPNPAPNITQGVPYTLTVQLYVPTTLGPATIDSVHVDSIGNVPSGLTYVFNPASGTVVGGGRGAICFSGTTNAPVGTDSLVFHGNAYTNFGPVSLTNSLVAGQFHYELNIVAAAGACDTISNLSGGDTLTIYTFIEAQGDTGFIAGNNTYGDEAKGE
ncbi:MAG: hypothetical protein JWO06_156, partial [Bacteroidota bacterium]|nr:hypothetical protein [Bacteroidota bacterium]